MQKSFATLVIDVGSSSVRALLFDEQCQLIPDSIVRQGHSFSLEATADPIHLRELVENCIDEVLQHPRTINIHAVGMATFVGNMLGVDQNYIPITPIFTYADSRSTADAEQLSQQHDLTEVYQRTGCRIHPAYRPAKLAWLKRIQPELFGQVATWTDFATYCYSTWFARSVSCSYSIASWSGLLNRHSLTWDEQWLDTLEISADKLPPLADYSDVQQGLQSDYAERWSKLQNVPFYLAVGDGAAANIGSSGTSADRPVLTVGTTAAIRIVSETSGDVPTGLWNYRVDAKRHLIGGATSEGGNIYAWAKKSLKLDLADLNQQLLQRDFGAHELTVLPFLVGERSPGYHADATGTIQGLRLDTSSLDVLQALLESVALRLCLIYDLLEQPGDAILAGGGALTGSSAWRQIIADTVGVPLHIVDTPEATAQGIAKLIAVHQGETADISPTIQAVITPRSGQADRVSAALSRQTQLYHALIQHD